jgi:hypothetical protein
MTLWLWTLQEDIDSGRANAVDALHQLALHSGPGGRFASVLNLPWDIFLLAVQGRTDLPLAVRQTAAALRVQSKLDQGQYQAALTLSSGLLSTARLDREVPLSADLWLYLQTRKLLAYSATADTSSAWSLFNSIEASARTIDSLNLRATEKYLMAVLGPNTGANGGKVVAYDGGSETAPNADTKQDQIAKPTYYSLSQNYPNPFNPVTTIEYALPENSHVRLTVYNVLGAEIARLVDEEQDAGYRSARFGVSNIPSGIYFYRLEAGNFSDIKKMVVLK